MRLGRRPTLRVVSPHRSRGARALTSAGQRVHGRETDNQRRLLQPWQAKAFAYYDQIPEIKYAAQFYARGLAPLKIFAAQLDDRGNPEETDNVVAQAMVNRIQDPGGGRSGLLSAYGRLQFLVGEAQLLVSNDPEGGEQWEMLSHDELRLTGNGYARYKAPSFVAEELREAGGDGDDPEANLEPIADGEAVAYRLWNRHPRFSYLADSTMQAVLEVCEELVGLTHAVRARIRSRIASAGILIVNGKISVVPLEPGPDEDPESDEVLDELINAAIRAISDPGSASAVVPVMLRVDGDIDVDKVLKHIKLVDPTELYPETGLRNECVKRLAIGLDMPPEVLTGIGGINHWGSWQVDEQTWKAHLQPVAQRFVDDLTAAYLRPTLRAAGVEDWQTFCVAYDATAVINHPDRGRDAKDAHDHGVIGDAALREALGFTDDDEPTEEERVRFIGIRVRDGSLALYGIPSKLGTGGIEPEAGQVEDGSSAGAVEPGPPPEGGSNAEKTIPGTVVGGGDGEAILGPSYIALQRAREIAGARLRNLAKRDPAAARALDGVPNSRVPASLGKDRATAIGAPPAGALIAGFEGELATTFSLWGLDGELVGPVAEAIAEHAAATLYHLHPAPLPAGFTTEVRRAREKARP